MSPHSSTDISEIMACPANYFEHPFEVLMAENINRKQKFKILEQWENDARLLSTAEAENMQGGERNFLQEVLQAKQKLHDEEASFSSEKSN